MAQEQAKRLCAGRDTRVACEEAEMDMGMGRRM